MKDLWLTFLKTNVLSWIHFLSSISKIYFNVSIVWLVPILYINIYPLAPWSIGYHYCTTSFNKVRTQVLRRFKSCSRRFGDSRWWGSLTKVPAGNKAKRLSSVNHNTKTIHPLCDLFQYIHYVTCSSIHYVTYSNISIMWLIPICALCDLFQCIHYVTYSNISIMWLIPTYPLCDLLQYIHYVAYSFLVTLDWGKATPQIHSNF